MEILIYLGTRQVRSPKFQKGRRDMKFFFTDESVERNQQEPT